MFFTLFKIAQMVPNNVTHHICGITSEIMKTKQFEHSKLEVAQLCQG